MGAGLARNEFTIANAVEKADPMYMKLHLGKVRSSKHSFILSTTDISEMLLIRLPCLPGQCARITRFASPKLCFGVVQLAFHWWFLHAIRLVLHNPPRPSGTLATSGTRRRLHPRKASVLQERLDLTSGYPLKPKRPFQFRIAGELTCVH